MNIQINDNNLSENNNEISNLKAENHKLKQYMVAVLGRCDKLEDKINNKLDEAIDTKLEEKLDKKLKENYTKLNIMDSQYTKLENKLEELSNTHYSDSFLSCGYNMMGSTTIIFQQKTWQSKLFYTFWTIYLYKSYVYSILKEMSDNVVVKFVVYFLKIRYGIQFNTLINNYLKIRKKFDNFCDFLKQCFWIIVKIFKEKYIN